MSEKKVYIHVGMPKTGTTFMQKKVFPHLQHVEYWTPFEHPLTYFFERISNNNHLTYPEEWKQKIREYLECSETEKHVLSFEGFFGSYTNNYKSNYTNSLTLKELFPSAKVILCIRNQVDIIESNYSQIVSEGFSGSINQYLNYRKGKFQNERSESGINLNIESLHLVKYIENYLEVFGTDNVLVLPFELLKNSRQTFLNRICDFLDVESISMNETASAPTKTSLSKRGMKITRVLNHVFQSDSNNRAGFIPKQPYINGLRNRSTQGIHYKILYEISKRMHPQYIAKKLSGSKNSKTHILSELQIKYLKDFYRESNSEIEALTGLNLKGFGYAVWDNFDKKS